MSHVVFLPVVFGASLGKPIPFHFHIELSHSSNQLHLMFQLPSTYFIYNSR